LRNERVGVSPRAKLPHYRAVGARDDQMEDGGELFVCVNEFNVFA
jgi:hypothetical protein